jgi:colicin import membrane protein
MVSERPGKPSKIAGRWPALLLAIAVHLVFIAVLIFSIRWQNRPTAPVTAELYAPTAKAPVSEPQVAPREPERKPEPPPAPVPQPQPPPPPKAIPHPEPKPEPPDLRAADIARKAKQEEERKVKEAIEREKLEREKKEAEKKKQDEQKRLAEARQAREAQEMKVQAEREKAARDAQQQAVAAEATARSRAEADYIRRIQAKVKGNVTLPPDLTGNPEAIFEVVQLPTGEIIDAVLKKSSGVRAYDEAVQRAIQKSSPLPRPDRPELFQRALTLKFRPQD